MPELRAAHRRHPAAADREGIRVLAGQRQQVRAHPGGRDPALRMPQGHGGAHFALLGWLDSPCTSARQDGAHLCARQLDPRHAQGNRRHLGRRDRGARDPDGRAARLRAQRGP